MVDILTEPSQSEVWLKQVLDTMAVLEGLPIPVKTIGFIVAMFVWVIGLILHIVIGIQRSKHTRQAQLALARSSFALKLMDALEGELLPRSRLRLRLDPHETTSSAHAVRTTQSSHGNTKTYYTQRWLTLAAKLPDRTQIKIALKDNQKTKAKHANPLKHHRQIDLKIIPGPLVSLERFGPGQLNQLRRQLQSAISDHFHDTPEAVVMRPRLREGALVVKVIQHDADILPSEVVTLVDAVIATLYDSVPSTRERATHDGHLSLAPEGKLGCLLGLAQGLGVFALIVDLIVFVILWSLTLE